MDYSVESIRSNVNCSKKTLVEFVTKQQERVMEQVKTYITHLKKSPNLIDTSPQDLLLQRRAINSSSLNLNLP